MRCEDSEIVEHFAVKKENKMKYLMEIENRIQQREEIGDTEDFHEMIAESAERTLNQCGLPDR